jgi:uroporphyrin-3 C-methyltransferase
MSPGQTSGSICLLFAFHSTSSKLLSDPAPQSSSRRLPGALWFLLAIAVILGSLLAWRAWSSRDLASDAPIDLRPEALDSRLLQVEASINSLRRGQEAMNQKLTDTRTRTSLLRDEVLASTQRASLLEDSVRELSVSRRDGLAALRLDEVELLLTMAQQRLQLAGDLPGAIRATELAEGVLSSQNDPGLLDLRQTMAQELSALKAMPKNPAFAAAGELDALQAVLPKLAADTAVRAATPSAASADATGVQRLLDTLVQVRPSGAQDLLLPGSRTAGEAALALELALARTALGKSDETAFRNSLVQVDVWLQRLYRDGPLLRERRQRLKKLRELSLSYDLPVAGTTLQQLQEIQRNRQAGR